MKELIQSLNLSENIKALIIDVVKLEGVVVAKPKSGKGFNILGIDVLNKAQLLERADVKAMLDGVENESSLNFMVFQGDTSPNPGIWIGKSNGNSSQTSEYKESLFA
tara:strand:- start:647 stop:967 length:321 start_codon:yes stop_codon:yes gene_type:complete